MSGFDKKKVKKAREKMEAYFEDKVFLEEEFKIKHLHNFELEELQQEIIDATDTFKLKYIYLTPKVPLPPLFPSSL